MTDEGFNNMYKLRLVKNKIKNNSMKIKNPILAVLRS